MMSYSERVSLPRWATLTAKVLADIRHEQDDSGFRGCSLETVREDADRAIVPCDSGWGYYVIPSIFS